MPKLTLKQRQFVKNYVENGGNAVQAALAVYNTKSYNTANQIALANLQSPTLQNEIERLLAIEGLTLSEISNKLRYSIDSGLGKHAKNADSLKGIEMALKLMNAFPSTKLVEDKTSLVEAYEYMSEEELIEELKRSEKTTEDLLNDLI